METQTLFAIERPDPVLMRVYAVRAVLSGPFFPFVFLAYYFRYHTLRYRFDDEGIHMRWGILFRREVNLTYARIQDIHLTSGPLLRWMGLADIQIQTASGSATAEMTIEGLREYEAIRDFLYTRMRGYRDRQAATPAAAGAAPAEADEAAALLRAMADDLRATREAFARLGGKEA